MPGKVGNKNAMRHGKYAFLAQGRAPDGCGYVFKLIGQFRRHLETEIATKHGEISTYHGALVQTICRHEGRAQLLTRWLREAKDPTLADKLAVLREIGNASDNRDKAMRALGLDRSAAAHARDRLDAAIDALYAEPDPADLADDQTAAATPAGQPGAQGAS